MLTAWESEDGNEPGLTRRQWVRLALAAGAIGTISAVTATVAGQLLPPPPKFEGEIRDTIYYTKWPTKAWWNDRQGRAVHVTDFREWEGATGVWRGLFKDGRWIPSTGLPALVIRLPFNAPEFTVPEVESLPDGYELCFEDPSREIRLVALYGRCPHLCCPPGWHVVTDIDPLRDYQPASPTHAVYGQDPIFCVCHGSQYDPLLLVSDVNPKSRAGYVGARHVHGPTKRALPVIPVRVVDDVLVGGMPDPRWYDPAC